MGMILRVSSGQQSTHHNPLLGSLALRMSSTCVQVNRQQING
jgi:hypothetical protein